MNRMIHMLFQFFLIWCDKTLMNRQASQGDAVQKCMFFNILHVGVILTFHLSVQNIYSF